MIKTYNNDCLEYLQSQNCLDDFKGRKVILVSDPPFNVGYHYNEYKDDLTEEEYYSWLDDILNSYDFKGRVIIHYPESLYKLSFQIGKFPTRVLSWVYNSNTARQHRDIAFFDVEPIMEQVKQPYKNPTDKRIKERIENGLGGATLYDWFNVNQVKNVSKRYNHPCIMPLEVMKKIIGVLPKDALIFDPFMGSATTALACMELGYDFIGTEINEDYYEVAQCRMKDFTTQPELF